MRINLTLVSTENTFMRTSSRVGKEEKKVVSRSDGGGFTYIHFRVIINSEHDRVKETRTRTTSTYDCENISFPTLKISSAFVIFF